MSTRIAAVPAPTRCLQLLLLLLSTLFAPAVSGQEVLFDHGVGLLRDLDGSGDLSCGDDVQFGLDLVVEGNAYDLTDVRVTVPFPSQLDLLPGSVVLSFGTTDSNCQLLEGNAPGDTRAVFECPFLCSSGAPACSSNGASLAIHFHLRDPNDQTVLDFQPTLTADQVAGTQVARNLNPFDDGYDPCPAPPPAIPPILRPTLDDSLLVDVDGDGRVDAGDTVRYAVVVRNIGEERATRTRIDIPAPDHGSLVPGSVTDPAGSAVLSGNGPGDRIVSLDLGSITGGTRKPLTFDVQVGPVPAGVDRISTQGLATAINADSQPTDDPATLTFPDETVTLLDFDPALSIRKLPETATAAPGEVVTWSLVVNNAGRAVAPRVLLDETVPDHTVFDAAASDGWSCDDASPAGTVCVLSVGDVPPGGSASFEFAVRVVGALPAGVVATTNEAIVTDDGSEGPDPDLTDNLDTARLELEAAPDLAVAKSGPATARPGDRWTYRLTVANRGTQDATGVRLVDTLDLHTRYTAGGSSPGWSCGAGGAGLGETCTLDVGDLAVSEERTFDLAVELAAGLPAGAETAVNQVRIEDDGANGADLDVSDNGDSVVTDLVAAPQLRVAKSGPDRAAPGEVVVFTLDFTNLGDQEATGIELRETVPAHTAFVAAASTPGWSCADGAGEGTPCILRRASLAAGEGGTVAFAVRLADTLPAGVEVVRNRVVLARDPGDDPPDGPPEEDDDEVAVDAAPDLAVAKDGPAETGAGTLVTYTLTVANLGTQDASGVVLEETPPAGTAFEPAASDPGWSCAGGPVSCQLALGEVEAGDTLPPVTFAVRVPDPFPGSAPPGEVELLNQVEVRDDGTGGPDADPTNNRDEHRTRIVEVAGPPPEPPVILEATLADDLPEDDGAGRAAAGEVIAYTAVVRNVGAGEAEAVRLEVPLDPHTRFLEGSLVPTVGSAAFLDGGGAGRVIVTVPALPPAERVVLTWEVRLADELPAGLKHVQAQGEVTVDGALETRTDDPDTPAPRDATRTPLEAGGGPGGPGIAEIPTLSEVGLAVLVALLLGLAMRRLRRRFGAEAGREVAS